MLHIGKLISFSLTIYDCNMTTERNAFEKYVVKTESFDG